MNTDIASRIAPSTVKDVGEIASIAEANKAQKIRNALAQQEMDMRQGDMQAEKNFNALMDQSGGDYNKAMEMAGDWRTKQRIQGYIGEQKAAQAKNQAGQLDAALKQLEIGAQLMGGVSDQASYDNAKNQMRQFGMNVDTMPAEYSPQFVQQAQQSALSFKDRIAQQRADLEAQRVAQGDRRIEAMLARANQPQQTAPEKGWSVKETANGLVRINEITGEVQPVQIDGQTVQGKSAVQKPVQASEDERKAAGWLEQARLAKSNMDAVLKESPTAASPSAKELALKAVLPESVEQVAYTPDRQKFNQAASQFAEATLRAATGAGITKDEASQKIKELTPQYGDSPEVIQQKLSGQEMYLKGLEARAGRAAIPQQQSAQPTLSNW